jgi:NADH pyrophosphatase NudC (nudix superfamily)
MHPRVDPVIITIAIDHAKDKVLLGRNVRVPSRTRR